MKHLGYYNSVSNRTFRTCWNVQMARSMRKKRNYKKTKIYRCTYFKLRVSHKYYIVAGTRRRLFDFYIFILGANRPSATAYWTKAKRAFFTIRSMNFNRCRNEGKNRNKGRSRMEEGNYSRREAPKGLKIPSASRGPNIIQITY